jgi:hypothetical protein
MIRLAGRNSRGLSFLGVLCCAWTVLVSCAPEPPEHHVRVQVVAAGPVAGAQVSLWWVDGDGHPLTRDGRRSRHAELSSENALAGGHTDPQGVVELPLGPAYGLIVLEARGGWTRDPWLDSGPEPAPQPAPEPPGEPSPEPSPEPPGSTDAGAPCTACDASPGDAGRDDGDGDGDGDGSSEMPPEIPVDIALRSVLIDFVPGPAARDVVISPLTTLAWALGEGRVSHPLKTESYYVAMTRASELLGEHFGGPGAGTPDDPGAGPDAVMDITQGPIPTGIDQPLPRLTPAARHLLVLQGMASLAQRLAEASSISGRSFHLLDLLAALLQDIRDGAGLLDGVSGDGPVVVGVCPVPEGCKAGDRACPDCWLDASTLSARLASALAFDVLPSPLNQTTLTLADVRPFIEHLQNSVEPELFDMVDPGELDSPAPILDVLSSTVFDERMDGITFSEDAVPVHTADETARIDLGQTATCPTVGKHVHRLAAPDANPLRWEVMLRDRTGWPVPGDSPVALEYRVRRRDPASLPGSAGTCGVDSGQEWLMDGWLPADSIASAEDGAVVYEVTLLRDRLPALATELQAEFEIVFRGRDALNKEAVACRCWDHVLLPVPLEVGDITVATGPGSLAARSLHPGNNIAPLLNGVPLEQAPALASFLIRNGTDEPAYVRFSVTEPLVHYTKCWRRSNAELSIHASDPQCVGRGECLLRFPSDRQTVVAVDTGLIEHLVTGLRVQEVTAQTSPAVDICAGCDETEHTIAPRLPSAAPRTYRVDLLVSDLAALAPGTAIEPLTYYFETVLAPPYLIPITGLIAPDILHICTFLDLSGTCVQTTTYQYYRILTAANLTMDDPLSAHVITSPLSRTPQQVTGPTSTELESFAWSTHEPNLPILLRPPIMETPSCPVVDGAL